MLQVLYTVEKQLDFLLKNAQTKSMYIDYHQPYVSRIWFDFNQFRVSLHKIEPSDGLEDVLFHPHPWQSAIRILRGSYEMGIGHSETLEVPKVDCKIILPAGACYEMTEKDEWHYVNPIWTPSYSLMVSGPPTGREMPVEPDKEFRELTDKEYHDIMDVVNEYYR